MSKRYLHSNACLTTVCGCHHCIVELATGVCRHRLLLPDLRRLGGAMKMSTNLNIISTCFSNKKRYPHSYVSLCFKTAINCPFFSISQQTKPCHINKYCGHGFFPPQTKIEISTSPPHLMSP